MINFEAIALKHLSSVKTLVEQTPYQTCQLSASALFCLAQKYDTQICFTEEFMFIRQNRHPWGLCYFLPISANSSGLKNAVGLLREYHRNTYPDKPLLMWGLTADMLAQLHEACPEVDTAAFETHRDWAEYIYETKTLQLLAGKKLQPKRNAANQFRRKFAAFTYENITPEAFDEVWEFQKWQLAEERKRFAGEPESLEWLEQENISIARSMLGWHEMNMLGGLIRINGLLKAFCIGCAINATTFDILFESAEHAYNGIFQVLEQEFIARNLAAYRYINREEDLGIAGLRFAKENLRPDLLLGKYWGRVG